MYRAQYYKDKTREEIEKDIRGEGFDPIVIINRPGYIYEEHQHPQTKLLAFLEGSMKLTVSGKVYDCLPGDKVIVPGNKKHKAVVGKNGCTFFWSEKII